MEAVAVMVAVAAAVMVAVAAEAECRVHWSLNSSAHGLASHDEGGAVCAGAPGRSSVAGCCVP